MFNLYLVFYISSFILLCFIWHTRAWPSKIPWHIKKYRKKEKCVLPWAHSKNWFHLVACSVLAGPDNEHARTHTVSHCPSRGRLRCLPCLWCQCFPRDNVSSCVFVSLHFHPFLLYSIERGLLWLTGVTDFYHTHLCMLSHHHCGYYNFHMNMSCSDCYGDRDMHSPTLTWLDCCFFFFICSLEYCFSATSVFFIKA